MEDALLLRGGTILTCDAQVPDLMVGDMLIHDGVISEIATAISTGNAVPMLDISGFIVFPGLVDAHHHLWESPHSLQHPDLGLARYFGEFGAPRAGDLDPDDLYDATALGLRRALAAGTTTTFDWCHATNTEEHALAALTAASDSGSRYVFGYGPPVALGYYRSDKPHPDGLEQIAGSDALGERSTMAAALRGPDLSPTEICLDDVARARALGVAVSMHVGTRLSGSGAISTLHDAGALGDDLQFVHATDSSPEELAMIAGCGARVVIPPVAELMMGTGHPPVVRLTELGIPFGLGIDTTINGPSDMFTQMRSTQLLLRAAPWNAEQPPWASTAQDVLRAATINSAHACWLSEVTGSLTPGKAADLVVFRPSEPVVGLDHAYAEVVWHGHESRIISVLVGGRETKIAHLADSATTNERGHHDS